MATEPVRFAVDEERMVSGLLDLPSAPRAGYVLAHGAGAGMKHPFMAAMARGLAAVDIAVLRYNFPYMETGSRRPDRPALATATVRAAVEEAGRLMPGLPLLAGGKSFGGRMTSQAQASEPLPGVRGLIFLGFPLHPPGKPSTDRADHLASVVVSMLFLQGTRDTLADSQLLEPLSEKLGDKVTLILIEDGDHSFHVRKASGRDDDEARDEMIADMVAWVDRTV
ncbi:MAG: alpha/beta hydrolase [Hyphomicrobiales bacterium]|nr:alpha/beta hydrolase [Hyphomicrobiales bacterium]